MKPYQIVDGDWIELIEGPYKGIIYKYGRVRLLEEDDVLRVQFEYNLQDGSKLDSEFVQYIGPILVDLIEEKTLDHSLIFVGGTDAH